MKLPDGKVVQARVPEEILKYFPGAEALALDKINNK
jgi:hypothetical protein